MSNSNEFSRRRHQPGMAAAILAALTGAAGLGRLGHGTNVRPAVRRRGRVRHGRSQAGYRKPHFSCGYRGWPRTTAGVAPGRGLDGPHGIPYRINCLRRCPMCGDNMRPYAAYPMIHNGTLWLNCETCDKPALPVADAVYSIPIRLAYGGILIPKNATREHRLELTAFADSRGLKTISEPPR